jgi:hypothetical protein
MPWTQADIEAMQARRAAMTNANRKNLAGGPKRKASQPATRIGIDPAFRKNGMGVCVISADGKTTFPRFKGRGLVEFVKWLKVAPDNVLVTIEDSSLQNTSFDTSGNKAVATRKARNVGCNQAASAYVVEFCLDRWGDKVVRPISPQQKGRKWTKEAFEATVASNGHELPKKYRQDDIDAYQLAIK